MTLLEYNQKFEKSVNEIERSIGQTMVNIGSNAMALIKKRVQESGIDAEGQKFPSYSKKPMLANRTGMTVKAYNRIASSKEKRKNLEWVTLKRGGKLIKLFVLELGYFQYRLLHGRQTDHVDFTFFGRMWSSMKILSGMSEHNNGIVTVGPGDTENMKKLEGNVKRKGEILDLSTTEISKLTEEFHLDSLAVFKRNGL